MKWMILCALVSAPALASSYRCQVTEFEDYAVEVNLNTGKAGLFDNDSWSVVSSTRPLNGVNRFLGEDSYGSRLEILFDTRESANLTNNYGAVRFEVNDRELSRKLIDCKYVPAADLYSEI